LVAGNHKNLANAYLSPQEKTSLPTNITALLQCEFVTYKCISGWTPDYTNAVCVARACLRSANAGTLLLPTTDTVTFGRRGFYYTCPAIWNSLSSNMTDMSMSFFSFSKLLKTLLFDT